MRLLSTVAFLAVFLMPVFVSAQEVTNEQMPEHPITCELIDRNGLRFWYMNVPGNGMNGRGQVQHPPIVKAAHNADHVDLVEQFGACAAAE